MKAKMPTHPPPVSVYFRTYAEIAIALFSFLATAAAATAAIYSYLAQRNQIDYENGRSAAQAYNEYIVLRTRNPNVNTKPSQKCYGTIVNILNDREFAELLQYQSNLQSILVGSHYAEIISECIDSNIDLGANKFQIIYDKIQIDMLKLDASLVGYRNRFGDPLTLCENFSGFLADERIKKAGRGKFILKAIELNEIDQGMFPNLVIFTQHVAASTNNFEHAPDCESVASKRKQ